MPLKAPVITPFIAVTTLGISRDTSIADTSSQLITVG